MGLGGMILGTCGTVRVCGDVYGVVMYGIVVYGIIIIVIIIIII